MRIPVYIMEEHHEAFYYWNLFIKNRYIPATGSYLLHVDHHDDMEYGGYDWDLERLSGQCKLEEIKEFTYNKLGIADFIVPAVYQGIFEEVHILKNLMPGPVREKKQFVKIKGNSELERGDVLPFIHGKFMGKKDSPYRFFSLLEGGLSEFQYSPAFLVLDVDLDYFAWDNSLTSVKPKRIEITEQAYKEYMENPYHPYRILPRRLLEMVEDHGRYYMEYREKFNANKLPSEQQIIRRMERLLDWLAEYQIRPAVIDICRSRFSGYLPASVFPWIEEEFIRKLKERMDIEIMTGEEAG